MIGRLFRQSANAFLKQSGYEIIPQYQLTHLETKYKQSVKEITEFVLGNHLKDVPRNSERINLLSSLYGTEIIEALHIVYYLNKTRKLKGDVCEFGIANGATSALIANEIKVGNSNLWLFDSFKGLSKPTKKDILINDIFGLGKMSKYHGSMKYDISSVEEKLNKLRFPSQKRIIVPGFIEKTVQNKSNLPAKIRFAYIDFDLYKPTLTTLNALDQRLVRSGIVIIDDYNFFSKGVKTAVEEFLVKRGRTFRKILPVKNSGNFIILQKKQ